MLAVVPAAACAQSAASETVERNEFGVIRMPYQTEMNGQALTLVSRVKLDTHYDDQDAMHFMFAWSTENAPALTAKFESLTTADGAELKVSDKKGVGTELEQWFVDVRDMPPVGTEILLTATVNSGSKGFFSVATLVMPFTPRWEDVEMSTGDQAKLYAFTQIGVNKESGSGKGTRFGDAGGGKLPIPGVEAALAVPALAAVALALAFARGRRAP